MIVTKYILEYPLNGDNKLLINTLSGAVDVVDKDTYEIIESLRNGKEVTEHKDLETLKERKYILDSFDEEKSLFKKYEKFYNESTDIKDIRDFIICPTIACNLKCIYCFEGDDHSAKMIMSNEKLEAIFKFIREQIEKDKDKPCKLTLFGGEPLLKTNKEIVQKVFDFADENDLSLTIITNGTNTDGYLEMFEKFNNKHNNKLQIQITLDGNKEIHDKRRIRADGKGTFDEIIKTIGKFIELGIFVLIRVNVDKENIYHLGEIENIFKEKGWDKSKKIYPYISPVLDNCLKSENVFKESELLQIVIDNYPEILEGKGFYKSLISTTVPYVKSFFNEKNDHKPWKLSYCDATGGNSIVFGPNGSMVTCLNYAGKEENMVGRFDGDGIHFDDVEIDKWRNRTIFRMPKCLDCKYCLVCGGGCPALSVMHKGDINDPMCSDIADVMSIYVEYIKKKFNIE